MTSRERFEVWIADKHATPLFKSYARAGWQAAERDALERAASIVDEVATRGSDSDAWVYSDAIRALIEQ